MQRSPLVPECVGASLVTHILIPVENIVIDVRDPEALLMSSQETREMVQKTEVLLTDIEDFCERFELPYDSEAPLKSLIGVLNLTLTEYSDEEFAALDVGTRKRLGDLGQAVVDQGSYIRVDKRRIKVQGIVAIMRKYFDRGINTSETVLRELDKNGVLYNKSSVQAIVPELRKEYGLPSTKLGQERVRPGSWYHNPSRDVAAFERIGCAILALKFIFRSIRIEKTVRS